ncbi:helix-turn-helix domain-containing protein [Xanthobacter sp. AM33]|uniref:helix-turn-helix domain-containing protein n=1 Tax=Xanthobacter sp. AM33 TaxID=3380644 RepID=UPI0039BEE3FF
MRQHRHGGVTHTRTKLSKAANLSAKPGPPHEHRGLTGKQLAAAAGIAPATLSQIEKGVRTGSVEMLRKIATALRVDLDDVA